jgi:hypothetical protein
MFLWKRNQRCAVCNCRLALLIYLNAVIAEYSKFSITRSAEDDDYDCALSAEHLFWSLVRGIGERTTNERIYMVLRMMGVLKRASKRTWQDIEEALYLFLTMPKDTTDLIKHVQAWDPGKLRKDVMAFSEHEFVASEIDIVPAFSISRLGWYFDPRTEPTAL